MIVHEPYILVKKSEEEKHGSIFVKTDESETIGKFSAVQDWLEDGITGVNVYIRHEDLLGSVLVDGEAMYFAKYEHILGQENGR